MRCETALERMLEADPAELRGDDGGELARHVAECARCARVAAALIEETNAVDRSLGAWAEAGSADAATDTALAALRADRAGRTDDVVPLRPQRTRGVGAAAGASRRDWVRKAWVPLVAAAAMAGVLFLGRADTPFPTGSGPAGTPFEPRVSVTPPPDRSAAIMETENPDITIVWLYQREGS